MEPAETPAAPAVVDGGGVASGHAASAASAANAANASYAIEVAHSDKLNLADFQNAVPLLRELAVVNHSDRETGPLQLRLVSHPPFIQPAIWRIDAGAPRARHAIVERDVQLDGVLLGQLTEAETATMTFTLVEHAATAQERVLATAVRQVELLPRNQWVGLSHLPDLVAAFVQPNAPAIDRLLKQAAQVLREAGKQPALDGYQGGARRAWELASALWTAVAGLGLDYALPPASFEHRGQKVRSAAQLMDGRIATCLDLALLFCSALEQAGLHPVIVFTRGHAAAGVWLRPDEFSSVVVDDVTAIRKRLRLQELVLFETTLVTARPAPSFSHATGIGAGLLAEAVQDQFELLVDIRRARLQRIKPLASIDSTGLAAPGDAAITAAAATFDDGAPDLRDEAVAPAPALDPRDRLARWQRKLLDLSLRNNLLNFRSGKKTLRLDAPEPAALEDALSDNGPIRLLPRPELMEGRDPRDQALHEQRTREDLRRQHALDALARREVFVSIDAAELETRLVELYRSARTTLQEGGANTLFLALGFLNWTRDDKAGQRYKAPLILVPVSLQRKSARAGFTVSLHEDEPRFNPTLVEMLRQDFQLNLGVLDGPLPRDSAGLDVAQIWRTVSHAVRDIKGWEVSDEVVLAPFSFAKYLMWVDLSQRTDQLRASPVVRHLIDTPREPYRADPLSGAAAPVPFPLPQRLDADYAPDQIFCPLPADSSQLSAVMAGAKGKDFVLIGPPGTGKSQTIANLIAQCLAEGKRVLFVSEKIAALEVVYRRLREVGLGEFCLELHSSKARKLDVIRQLQQAWDARGDADPAQWHAQALKLKRLRDDLNHYVERLHHRHRNGLSIFAAIGNVVEGDAGAVPQVALGWADADAHDQPGLDALRELSARLQANAAAVGVQQLQEGPLTAIGQTEWTPSWQQALVAAVRETMAAADAVQQALLQVSSATGLAGLSSGPRARLAIAGLLQVLPAAYGQQWSFAFRPEGRAALGRLRRNLATLASDGGQGQGQYRAQFGNADIHHADREHETDGARLAGTYLASGTQAGGAPSDATVVTQPVHADVTSSGPYQVSQTGLHRGTAQAMPDGSNGSTLHAHAHAHAHADAATADAPTAGAAPFTQRTTPGGVPDSLPTSARAEPARPSLHAARDSLGGAAWLQAASARSKTVHALLSERATVEAALGKPWAADIVAELERGLQLLDEYKSVAGALALRYGEQIEQLDVQQLQRSWRDAEASIWPLSWWRKRGLTRILAACLRGTNQPDVAQDLGLLARVRELRADIEHCWTELDNSASAVARVAAFEVAVSEAIAALAAPHEDGSAPNAWRSDGRGLSAAHDDGRALNAQHSDGRVQDRPHSDGPAQNAPHSDGRVLNAAYSNGSALNAQQSDGRALSAAHDDGRTPNAQHSDGRVQNRPHSDGPARTAPNSDGRELNAAYGNGRALNAQQSDGRTLNASHGDGGTPFAPHDGGRAPAAPGGDGRTLASAGDDSAALRQAVEMLVGDGNTQLAPGGAVAAAGRRYAGALDTLHAALDKLLRIGVMRPDGVSPAQQPPADMAFDVLPLDQLMLRCSRLLAAEARLKSWCAWRKVQREAQSQALAPLVAAIETGAVSPAQAVPVFEINYSRWWLNRAVDSDDVIRSFVSAEHERRIGDFRALDRQFTELTRSWIRTQLCAGLPRTDEVTRHSEWGVLRHEIGKKKQHLPLRELMHSIPTVLGKLAPCLLMSPLSIAQYLAADSTAFDLVVFDEASQIPVWDAIGAMARGRQVVMVGDPKQLPPTSFFDRADAEDDEEIDVDLESILDECMGANLPTMNLAWHYRSRNESLIAFSNHRYYGGGLVTFPSPLADDRAVNFHHVAGVYDKGGARTNQREAQALVADIVARLRSPGFRQSKLTIGVVTFNTEQMHLIEDLLDEERRKDPALEPYFLDTDLEPLFVKNLESVQGDERDIIYFSVTYGPDQSGSVSMNFGPLNRDGGERRLNVAITRARQELRVFSSLRAEQFDLTRTQAAGVRDFKHFLAFAERGPRALAEADQGSLKGAESPFEAAVAAALAARGWQVHTQIGASLFRVDLGIVHPDAPGVYLCGVECDGATYHRSATARDRDLLREQVLRGLGWEIVRIWSTDWWIDRSGTLDQVHGQLERLLADSRRQRSAETGQPTAPVA